MKSNALNWIGWILVVIGAINWGLIGLFKWDLVAHIFGDMSTISRIVYVLVGLAGIWLLIMPPRKSGV